MKIAAVVIAALALLVIIMIPIMMMSNAECFAIEKTVIFCLS